MIFALRSVRRCLIRMPYYAVEVGRNPGVYQTWSDCQSQIHNYPGAKYKKFPTLTGALEFVKRASVSQTSMDQTSLKGRAIRKETAGPSNIETLDCPGGSSSSSSSSSSDDEHMPYPADEQMNDTLVTVTSRSLLAFKSTLNKVKQTVGQLQEYIRHAEEQLHVLEESGKGKKRSAPSEQNDLSNESIGTTKRKRKDTSGPVSVYTDGCCHGNQTNTRRAGIGVYWGPNHPMNVGEPLVGIPTNNRAEIQAACRAIQQARDIGIKDLVLHTDSDYVIKCMTKYIRTWKRNGWKLVTGEDVKNQKDLKELDVLRKGDVNVTWVHVRGHQGIEGNEEADRLANEGALKSEIHKLD